MSRIRETIAACDQCRKRKLRCAQTEDEDRCERCRTAGEACSFTLLRKPGGWAGGSALVQARLDALHAAQLAIELLADASSSMVCRQSAVTLSIQSSHRDYTVLGEIVAGAADTELPPDIKRSLLQSLIAALDRRGGSIEQAVRVRALLQPLLPDNSAAMPASGAPFASKAFDWVETDAHLFAMRQALSGKPRTEMS